MSGTAELMKHISITCTMEFAYRTISLVPDISYGGGLYLLRLLQVRVPSS